VFLLCSASQGQLWKHKRYELSLGVGASNFLGDLGGANQYGTHYFRDLNWMETRFAFAAGLRYKLSEYFAVNTHLTYASVAGDDKLTKEFFRNNRNLSFHSVIWEYNVNFEANLPTDESGHLYKYENVHGEEVIYPYIFAGIGVFYFNPQADLAGGNYTIDGVNYTIAGGTYNLHDYHTEGEGLPGRPKQYSLVQFCIPMGVGFKLSIDPMLGVGVELGIRKTFTDYIDDVSTTYVYPPVLISNWGPISAVLADRSSGLNPGHTLINQQRGDAKYNDSYMFAVFSITIKIHNSEKMLPIF